MEVFVDDGAREGRVPVDLAFVAWFIDALIIVVVCKEGGLGFNHG